MKPLLLNLLLTLLWCTLTESFEPTNIALGLILGYGALWVARPVSGPTAYFSRLGATLYLLIFFFIELITSSLQVAWSVVTPGLRFRPGLVAVPLDLEDDGAITVLAMLVSLTPGTLALDVSEDRRTLSVHAMFADDPEAVRRSIKEGLERRVRAVFGQGRVE